MPTGEAPDPVRATLVAILQQLNRVESIHEGRAKDQALELADIERMLDRFWAIERGGVKVPLALGLLVRNRLVEVHSGSDYPRRATPSGRARYRITAEGKRFLVEALEKTDRIA
ncbi:MAG TPA: hypothetical protein VEH57_01635 [Thermoplasmata archaeon]|nr:hypothetical protein [Thermoplasmata archaeon]